MDNFKLLITICFLFLSIINLKAQQNKGNILSGKVIDASSGNPIPFATISLVYEKNGVSTDTLGNYKIWLPHGEHVIKVSSVGYLAFRKKIDLQGDITLNISLESISNQLSEVIVSASQMAKKLENVSLGVEILSIKGIKKIPVMMGEVDVLRSIQTLPGVSSVGEGANGLNIRGGSVDQNLIYVDHTPIFNPTHMFGLFSVFSADAIQDVELYKGGIPAKYGGRTSSVMNIKMIDPQSEKLKLSGGIGFISNRLTFETPIVKNKLWIMASSRLSYNDYLLNIANFPGLQKVRANFYDIATKVFYRINKKNTLAFSGYLSNDQYKVDSLFALSNIVAKETNFKYGHKNGSIQWNHFFSTKLNLNVIGAYSKYSTKTTSPDSSNAFELTSGIEYKNLKAIIEYSPKENHEVTMGLSAIRYDIKPGNLNQNIISAISPVNLDKEQSYEMALFASDEFKVTQRLKIEYGLRYVYYANIGPSISRKYDPNLPKSPESASETSISKGKIEKTYSGFEPRLTARFKISERTSLKFGYNRMQQFIQLLSNNITPLPISRWKTANSNISPQKSDFYSLGFFQELNEKWEFSVEGYFRKTNNMLDYTASANLQLNNQIETLLLKGKGKAYGVETMITKKKGELTGWMSYTYARSLEQIVGDIPSIQQLNGGKYFPTNYDHPHNVNLMLNIEPDKHNSFSFVFTYSTGRPYTSPTGYYNDNNARVLIFTERNNDRVSDYHRLDFSWTIKNATMKKKKWEGSWVFAVYNLYGRKNAYSYFYRQEKLNASAYKLSVFAYPLISLTYNFVF